MDGILENLDQLGLGGLFAIVVFLIFRKTVERMDVERENMRKCLESLLDRYDATLKENSAAHLEHAAVQSELLTWLKKENGRK